MDSVGGYLQSSVSHFALIRHLRDSYAHPPLPRSSVLFLMLAFLGPPLAFGSVFRQRWRAKALPLTSFEVHRDCRVQRKGKKQNALHLLQLLVHRAVQPMFNG